MLTPRHENCHHIDDIELEICELMAKLDASKARLLEFIRKFDEAMGWEGPGLNSCAHWLNWKWLEKT